MTGDSCCNGPTESAAAAAVWRLRKQQPGGLRSKRVDSACSTGHRV